VDQLHDNSPHLRKHRRHKITVAHHTNHTSIQMRITNKGTNEIAQ